MRTPSQLARAIGLALLATWLLDPSTAMAQCCQCGNGVVQAACNEECDDGNLTAWDGCSPTCLIEPECHDVLNIDDTGQLDALLQQAIDSGITNLIASGVDFDWTSIAHRQLVFDRLPAELGCALNLGAQQDAAAATALAETYECPAPREGDCLGAYDSDIDYCSFGCDNLLTVSCNGYDCLNCSCFQHDNCTSGLCVGGACQFIGNGTCDSNFFTTTRDTCGRDMLTTEPFRGQAACSILVYAIAKAYGAFNKHLNPACDPDDPDTCSGLCDRCEGCTGTGCGTVQPVCRNVQMSSQPVLAVATQDEGTCFTRTGWDCPPFVPGCLIAWDCQANYINCAGGYGFLPYGYCRGGGGISWPASCGNSCGSGLCDSELYREAAWSLIRSCEDAVNLKVHVPPGPHSVGEAFWFMNDNAVAACCPGALQKCQALGGGQSCAP